MGYEAYYYYTTKEGVLRHTPVPLSANQTYKSIMLSANSTEHSLNTLQVNHNVFFHHYSLATLINMAPIFTRQQVADFFDLIDLPPQYRKPDKVSPSPMLLRVLHTNLISTVRYETLVLHYRPIAEFGLIHSTFFTRLYGTAVVEAVTA